MSLGLHDAVLARLRECGSGRSADIARDLGFTPAQVGQAMRHLRAQGLVTCRENWATTKVARTWWAVEPVGGEG